MDLRGNDYDVSAQFNTTDPQVVNDEVDRIYRELYPYAPTKALDRAFRDLTRLYRGEYPGYHPCDTPYHDVQHVLDVTLASRISSLVIGVSQAGQLTRGCTSIDSPAVRRTSGGR